MHCNWGTFPWSAYFLGSSDILYLLFYIDNNCIFSIWKQGRYKQICYINKYGQGSNRWQGPGHSTAKCEVMVSLGWGMDFKLRSTNELVGIIEQIRSWHYRVDQNCNVLTQETLSLSVYHIVIMKYKISTNVFRVSVHLSFWLVQWWRNWYKRKL